MNVADYRQLYEQYCSMGRALIQSLSFEDWFDRILEREHQFNFYREGQWHYMKTTLQNIADGKVEDPIAAARDALQYCNKLTSLSEEELRTG